MRIPGNLLTSWQILQCFFIKGWEQYLKYSKLLQTYLEIWRKAMLFKNTFCQFGDERRKINYMLTWSEAAQKKKTANEFGNLMKEGKILRGNIASGLQCQGVETIHLIIWGKQSCEVQNQRYNYWGELKSFK